jgi:phosphopantetheinyl transferase
MPLVYQQNINAVTKMGVWHITEGEDFFLQKVPLRKEIRHWHKRLQHLAGRYLLQELYPNFPLELIKIADTRKPFLEDEAYHFSISHCGDYAAVLVSREYRVGVDVELVTPKAAKLMHKFLSAQEQLLVAPDSIATTATLCWSVKEAIYKWKGTGEVDFIKHMHIKSITDKGGAGLVDCVFNNTTALKVHYLFFNNNFLTWLLTSGQA